MKRIKSFLTHFMCLVLINGAVHAQATALFSPKDKPTSALITLINNARKSIHAAVYLLTDKTIAEALIKAKKQNNVKITLVLDQFSTDRYGKADLLALNNIDVHIFRPHTSPHHKVNGFERWASNGPIMHNKFAIFDSSTLWTGSFNWTVAANTSNQENVIIISNRELCKQYEAQFTHILTTYCKKHNPHEIKRGTDLSLRNQVIDLLKTTADDVLFAEHLHNLLAPYQA